MRRNISALGLSKALVDYLRKQGQTLREIGELAGLSESFISRVAGGQRSFTIDHLQLFEEQLDRPLPALLLETMYDRDSLPPKKREEFDEVLRLLTDLGAVRRELVRNPRDGVDSERRSGNKRRSVG